jgi:hypothetical protein
MVAVAIVLFIVICIVVLYKISVSPVTEGFVSTSYTLPRTIWSYWHDPVIPPKVASMLEERAVLPWEHIVLNQTTVYEYIDPSLFPKGYDELSHQHQADWIRLYILKVYGGCWMDASILVNSGVELESLYQRSLEAESEFTGFYLQGHTLGGVPETYIENWFIMAPKGSRIIELWYKEYTMAVEIGFKAYKKRVFSKIDVSNIYARGDDNTYLTQHSALQYVLRVLTNKANIIIVDASDTMFKPHVDCNWDTECTLKFIKETPREQQPAFIKLRSNERNLL